MFFRNGVNGQSLNSAAVQHSKCCDMPMVWRLVCD